MTRQTPAIDQRRDRPTWRKRALPDDDLPIDPEQLGAADRPLHPSILLVIALGGALGTLARYAVGVHWPVSGGHFPISTFLINTTGAGLIGLFVVVIIERYPRHVLLRPASCVGLLGGWTTMSTVALESDHLLGRHSIGLAACYLAATLFAGMTATVLGMFAGRRLTGTRATEIRP